MEAITRSHSGFEIAEMDLRIRGPGQIFGTLQAGFPEFRFADLSKDIDLIRAAREEAHRILAADPDLSRPEHVALRDRMAAVELEVEPVDGEA